MTRTTTIVLILVAIVAIGGAAYWYSGKNSSTTTPTGTTSSKELTVTYTDSGFSPASVTIAKGGVVMFKNNSSAPMRVASDPHPTHTNYPDKGGCSGSTFDSCNETAPGDSWVFVFDTAGNWGYHDHLNPKHKGIVIVQ
jgi:plastocyanin